MKDKNESFNYNTLNANQNAHGGSSSSTSDSWEHVRSAFLARRRQYITNRLENNFPFNLCLLFSISQCVSGLIGCILQTVLIVNKASNYYIASGIWGGLVCISIGLLNLYLGLKPSSSKIYFIWT
jgi:hypothetical protein